MSSVLNALYTMFVGMTASFYNIFLFFFFFFLKIFKNSGL